MVPFPDIVTFVTVDRYLHFGQRYLLILNVLLPVITIVMAAQQVGKLIVQLLIPR